MNEADTCRTYVVPNLQAADWDKAPYSAATRGVGARRERIRPEMLLGLEMPFPNIEKQTEAVKVLTQLRSSHELSGKAAKTESAILPSLLDQIFAA